MIYGLLGIQTLRALASRGGGLQGESGHQAQTWTARLLELPSGRALVFALLALFAFRAAREANAREVGGVSKSLATLAQAPYGRVALGVVALGLVAYGAYQLATARFRRMRAM